MKLNNQTGLTFIELIIVMVIMGIMFIFAVPNFTSTSHSKLKSAVRDVATELQMARAKAIYRNMEYRVLLTLNAGTTTADTYIFQCKMSGGACSSSGSWPANTVADPERLNMAASGAVSLPLAVNVTQTNGNSGTVTVEFNPNGTSNTAGLCFINANLATDVIKLCVSSSTGRVRMVTATSCGAC
ncbi:MAG: GspH/FimT family pseudopilin [Deltaproteobacteria bacterium]|nr:GspH/FimT family pseudopilin [Deltaproteobacteria bacterium]